MAPPVGRRRLLIALFLVVLLRPAQQDLLDPGVHDEPPWESDLFSSLESEDASDSTEETVPDSAEIEQTTIIAATSSLATPTTPRAPSSTISTSPSVLSSTASSPRTMISTLLTTPSSRTTLATEVTTLLESTLEPTTIPIIIPEDITTTTVATTTTTSTPLPHTTLLLPVPIIDEITTKISTSTSQFPITKAAQITTSVSPTSTEFRTTSPFTTSSRPSTSTRPAPPSNAVRAPGPDKTSNTHKGPKGARKTPQGPDQTRQRHQEKKGVPTPSGPVSNDDPISTSTNKARPEFQFTRSLYTGVISENSPPRTFVIPEFPGDRMGIPIGDEDLKVSYLIVGGDRDRFFKAEARIVGNFCFLQLRTRAGNVDVLNRERRDHYTLEIRANAVPQDRKAQYSTLEANTTVIIKVLDMNDLNPLFTPTEYDKTVPEDTPLQRSVLRVLAEDADLGRNGEVYYSLAERSEQWAVNPTTGVLTLTRPLAFSEQSVHELVVIARDRGEGKSNSAKVTIRVEQVNLHHPEIIVDHLPEIIENSHGDIYAIVRVVDRDKGKHGEVDALKIVAGDPDGHFRVMSTGKPGEYNIVVLHLLDREAAPKGYNLTLRATDKGTPQHVSYKNVFVKLADLNDNAPVFDREVYEVDIPETAPINTPVVRLKVTDADAGRNALVYLEIVGGNKGGEFYLNPETGMLYTATTLDAESKTLYTLTVSAIDQGNAGTRKQSSAKVKINVKDTNDNDPLFDTPEMTIWVNENEPAGLTVIKVNAKDRDSGENAYISYSIANLSPVPFEIKAFAGTVTTTEVLNYEEMRREFVLRVRASDWGLPFRRQTEMTLRIKIRDVNDNRPQFQKVNCVGNVPRYIPIGTELLTLSAIDFDVGSTITYRIESGNEDSCFNLEPKTGSLSLACDLADVRVSHRELNVTASDGTHFSDLTKIVINLVNSKKSPGKVINDENGYFDCQNTTVAERLARVLATSRKNNAPGSGEDFAMMPSRYGENVHAPEFIDFPVEIRVNESVPLGTSLLRLRARDRDLGYNGKLVYSISSGDRDSVFRVDLDTGELRVIGYLDREHESEYVLNITVYDLGTPQKSISRILPVTILDVNDNAPKFEKTLASFRVTENALNGTSIFRVNATDPDSGDNGRVTYFLETGANEFAVDPVTGVISTIAALDRERQDVYELKIIASDHGRVPHTAEALVRVQVDDVNDNAPTFALQAFSVRVLEDIPTGSVIAVLPATDPDLGQGGEVRYSIREEDEESWFRIDPLTGTVRTSRELDYEARQLHQVTVRAMDRGTPSLYSEAALNVHIIDVNENIHPPVFSDLVHASSVRENMPTGTPVTSVRATDADEPGDDSRVTYSIRGGDGQGYFSIDEEGNIRTLVVLDAETRAHYWLAVVAQDHGVVPLSARQEVYIGVENVNDHYPLTLEPMYRAEVAEHSAPGKWVTQLRAADRDRDPNHKLTFKITGGNPESFFAIHPDTGVITTTERRLNREIQPEHNLEVTVSDNGSPPLSTTTRVSVTVLDVNDNAPQFELRFYHVVVPGTARPDTALFQNGRDARDTVDASFPATDVLLENGTWETFDEASLTGERLFRVLAFDDDAGPNGQVEYSIKSGRGKGKFKIHQYTGTVYSSKELSPGTEYDLLIRATDQGTPERSATTTVTVKVVAIPTESKHPPRITTTDLHVQLWESDKAGYQVALIQATDEDNDTLWFDIVDGDKRNEFFIGRDNGNILLAKQLDFETQKSYNLTISVTDQVHTIYTQLKVTVLDVNEYRPELPQSFYKVDVAESAEVGTHLLEITATDRDANGAERLFYSLHSASSAASLELFRVDSITGVVSLAASLDCEAMDEHILTVMVKDQGTPPKRNFARIHVIVHDFNDHAPEFTSPIIQGRVYETASVGSSVIQALATDYDRGNNAKITYSIISGNVGNMFEIDPSLGNIIVARELDMTHNTEYMLHVKATDAGSPPLSATVRVHIIVTMADNAPPKFAKGELAAEMYENLPAGTYVKHVEVRSSSSCTFEIVNGDKDDVFLMNPSTGVVTTKKPLDYEQRNYYNLTVEATNMAGAKTKTCIIIHVLDRNDNAPRFIQNLYEGELSESSTIGTLVLTKDNAPLVIKAEDKDSELNARLHYDIVEFLPRKYFHIDSSTGAIRTVNLLDHETMPLFEFHVKVSDLGKPRLTSETLAKVRISITDVNDCAPQFSEPEYNVTLLLPTFHNVVVLKLNATDRDSNFLTSLQFDLEPSNEASIFKLNSLTGLLTVVHPEKIRSQSMLYLKARVTDGKFTTTAPISINVQRSENSGLKFQKDFYSSSIVENSTKIVTVAIVNVLGAALNEDVHFRILNPTDMFIIGPTSGAVRTTGKPFDREAQETYELIVEAQSEVLAEDRIRIAHLRVAHVTVNVTILDINDNCPIFVNLPYYAVASVDAEKGDVVTKVQAVDLDKGENGEVRYELIRGPGELFKVLRKSGEIVLKQNLENHNKEYQLVIAAYDSGMGQCSTETRVQIKVIDRSMPVFGKQFYSVIVKENVELYSPLSLSISAESALGRKLIYSIVKGNDYEEFAVDFNTGSLTGGVWTEQSTGTASSTSNGACVLYVVDELDYEQKKFYELTLRAVDSVSGVSAEVIVNVQVEDVNDCPPEFSSDLYQVSVSEAATFGSPLLKVVTRDNDTGVNAVVRYSILPDVENSTDYFHIDPEDGSVYLKQSLDREKKDSHHFTIIATDTGSPSLSTSAHVWVTVLDMNDNSPKFEESSYTCQLSRDAVRGQFITMVTASDLDTVDQGHLTYSIVGGNEQQTFAIQPSTGIIRLVNLHQLANPNSHSLNISATDGVYTSFTRVRIDLQAANHHDPVFTRPKYDASVPENRPPGARVGVVKATDNDSGSYGQVTYSITSPFFDDLFAINKDTGEIQTRVKLDREQRHSYEMPVAATDSGGRLGHTMVRIRVTDENDNSPRFLQREYKASIHSNLTVNSGFLKVKTVDADEELNALVEYFIYEKESSGVKELFGVNRHTGGIYLLKNAAPSENQVFQFFVRAQDRGRTPRYSDAPIEIYIMGSNDVAPSFQKKEEKFFLTENAHPGTLIAGLKLTTNVSVSYRIVSSEEENPTFSVDSGGQLTLLRSLDWETSPLHNIAILAETLTSPPLVGLTEITLIVLDENDNAPVFHTSSYSALVAENVNEGTSIIKVIAEDADGGANKEIRYSIEIDSSGAANMFAVDTHTGWISTMVPLDRELQQHYKLTVIASDLGHPKHTAHCNVHIRLQDYNDSPPVFTKNLYKASVNEDALPGTVITQLATTDADAVKKDVDLYIVSGDLASQLAVRRTGEVYVVRALDRESVSHYQLEVVATDGKFVTSTNVSIEVLDANDNPPYCLRHRYREVISEGADVGTFVLSVRASDLDEGPNAKLRFYLTGTGADHFTLDKNGGHLRTSHYLDRETQNKYILTAHVQDRDAETASAGWECSSEVEILISDLNDNAPKFSMESYTASIPEDSQIGTLVTKLHATDNDIGINRKIRYSIVDDGSIESRVLFRISSDSGIVTLAQPLDREMKDHYNLTVEASDQGTPRFWTRTYLLIRVLDVNDNPPEFVSKIYIATVPEMSPVNTSVVRVMATSKDIGINADISYKIVSGNEHEKFAMDSRTGELSIREELDYEVSKRYFLTIEAKDGGDPPLSNQATVNISVTDNNDNAPVFSEPVYSIRIREDLDVKSKVLKVSATDLDSEENGRVKYSITSGDNHEQFAIDPVSGYISVAKRLDRETLSSYVLELTATDTGYPPRSSIAHVNIELSDVNDNPPKFSQMNYTAVLQENKLLGYPIIQLEVTDDDTFPNTEPFIFDIIDGNEHQMFRLEQDGVLRTAARFNHKNKDTYLISVRVFDNGLPPLHSDTWIMIKIIEESQYPPVVTPLDIWINSYQDNFIGGQIGKVHATDQDKYDQLKYGLMQQKQDNLFSIFPNNGSIVVSSKLDVGQYRLNVSVTDGKFFSHAIVKVSVVLVSDEMLQEALSITFRGISARDFILSRRKGFIKTVRNMIGAKAKDVVIISVQNVRHGVTSRMKRSHLSDLVMVLFAVHHPNGSGFISADSLRHTLSLQIKQFEMATELSIEEISQRHCTDTYCAFGRCEDRVFLNQSSVAAIDSQLYSFVSPQHRQQILCHCNQGYSGERCDMVVNECANDPCPASMSCVPDSATGAGYSCQCPVGFIGPACQEGEPNCQSNVCYKAHSPVGFSGRGFALFGIQRPLLEEQLNISMRLRTLQPSSCLLYIAGKVDYAVLEVVNGVLQFRMDLGSGEGLVRLSSIAINDGRWHDLKLERQGNTAQLTVDGTHMVQGVSPGPSTVLNTGHNSLFLGAEVDAHPTVLGFESVSRGLVGCMDEVEFWGVSAPLHVSGSSSNAGLKRLTNIQFTCGPLLPPGPCGSQPCLNGGTCEEDPDLVLGYSCTCNARYIGLRCEKDTAPCSSSPCLFGGRCSPLPGGDFKCDCEVRLSGKRCEYGRYCSPNRCAHDAACEEGDAGPLCKCPVGYTGEFCSLDVNECDSSPCLNGGTCFNRPGTYYCICPVNVTGFSCNIPLYNSAISSSIYNITWEELIGIGAVVGIIILLVIIFVVYRRFRVKHPRNRQGKHINNETHKDIVLNSARLTNLDFKRSSKLSNLEVSQREPLTCPVRPASFTPSTHNEQLFVATLNNLDTMRSYGSAGDELENVPPDYLRNLNRHSPITIASAPTTPQLTLTEMSKINNMPGLKTPEDSCRSPGYHWDCSDWVRPSQPALPNITEVPGSEVPDSSSFHSDESNESRPSMGLILPPAPETINSSRDMETLNEEECVDDAEDVDVRTYLLHPNEYLPNNALPESEDEDNNLVTYGFPDRHNRRPSLLGSQSDLSAELCDIEDSEMENGEIHRPWGSVAQTSV